ncbi:hypothetical protein SEA_CEN1621_64 [Microbacterium phage Cen1621]|uniref:Uncharacterized protein n=1 Tax=Microbacterium phage Cen1621 TaxID=2965191 RepID=A0A9E7TXN8_9CAUD|nr:hypothetical protein SEA_CEN1621_64 [Microbacterium phage Cen1621]
MTADDPILDSIREERRTQLRPIIVREPSPRQASHSGGVELYFEHTPQLGSVVDLNRRELEDLVDKALVFLTGRDLATIREEEREAGYDSGLDACAMTHR